MGKIVLILLCVLTSFLSRSNGHNNLMSTLKINNSACSPNNVKELCKITKVLKNNWQKKCCCVHMYNYMKTTWTFRKTYLSTYLALLKYWDCEEFEEECDNPSYKFNSFTSVMYQFFCNKTSFNKKCSTKVDKILNPVTFLNASNTLDINKNTTEIPDKFSKINKKNVFEPCVQVGLFQSVGVGRFTELAQAIPFCGVELNGVPEKLIKDLNLTPWQFLESSKCRSIVIGLITFETVLSLAIIIANVTVIGVFVQNPILRNVQWMYKLSLAIADLIVGITALPSLIANQVIVYIKNIGHLEKYYESSIFPNSTGENYFNSNNFINRTFRKDGLILPFSSRFNNVYIPLLGGLTFVSIYVSLYTLLAASADRFLAVVMPFRYNIHWAKRASKYICAFIWIVVIIIGILIAFVKNLNYQVHYQLFITVGHGKGVIVCFAITLGITWFLTLSTFFCSHCYSTKSNSINERRKSTEDLRLAQHLVLMGGVFTLCVFPTVAVFLLGEKLFSEPEQFIRETFTRYLDVEYSVMIILLSNSLWNCCIYSLRIPRFREGVKILYKDLWNKLLCRGEISIEDEARRTSLFV